MKKNAQFIFGNTFKNNGNTDATYSFLDMRMFNHKFFLKKIKEKKG